MNKKGFAFINIIAFIVGLFLLGLYIAIGEPIIAGFLDTSVVAGPGTTPYYIILGAPIVILFACIYILTKPEPIQFQGA